MVVAALSFIFRENEITNTFCMIGIKRIITIPLTSYDVGVNVYLTILFLLPLRKLPTFEQRGSVANKKLRQMTKRCVMGTMVTTFSTAANLSVLASLGSEQAWLCLMCCNADLTICVATLHWITSFGDHEGTPLRVTHAYKSSISTVDEKSVPNSPEINGNSRYDALQGISRQLEEGMIPESIVVTTISSNVAVLVAEPSVNGISVQLTQSQTVEHVK